MQIGCRKQLGTRKKTVVSLSIGAFMSRCKRRPALWFRKIGTIGWNDPAKRLRLKRKCSPCRMAPIGLASQAWGVGILGVLLAVVFYLRGKRRVQVSYHIEHTQLLGGSRSALPEQVKITYDENLIANLRKANLIVWNSGTEAIRIADIVGDAFATIRFPAYPRARLLKASIVKSAPPTSGVSIISDPEDEISIHLVFLEPKQGFNVELLYDGDQTDPVIKGTVIGMPQGIQRALYVEGKDLPNGVMVPLTVIGLGLGAIISSFVFHPTLDPYESPWWTTVGFLVFTFVIWFVTLGLGLTAYFRWKGVPNVVLPKELKT